jgi:hypothetical protein
VLAKMRHFQPYFHLGSTFMAKEQEALCLRVRHYLVNDDRPYLD